MLGQRNILKLPYIYIHVCVYIYIYTCIYIHTHSLKHFPTIIPELYTPGPAVTPTSPLIGGFWVTQMTGFAVHKPQTTGLTESFSS